MLHEYDVVILKKSLPGIAVPVASEGTIVMVHDADAQAYEVEFFDRDEKTIDVCTVVGDEYLELKWANKDRR
jgi:putative methionine-R-sulfoxide reductase with GAF domain